MRPALNSVPWGARLSAGKSGLLSPNPRLCFQVSVPRGLGPKPPRLRTPEPHPTALPATWEESMLFGAAQNPLSKRNLHTTPWTTPIFGPPSSQTGHLTLSLDPSLNSAPGELPSAGALRGAAWAWPVVPDGRNTCLARKSLHTPAVCTRPELLHSAGQFL